MLFCFLNIPCNIHLFFGTPLFFLWPDTMFDKINITTLSLWIKDRWRGGLLLSESENPHPPLFWYTSFIPMAWYNVGPNQHHQPFIMTFNLKIQDDHQFDNYRSIPSTHALTSAHQCFLSIILPVSPNKLPPLHLQLGLLALVDPPVMPINHWKLDPRHTYCVIL